MISFYLSENNRNAQTNPRCWSACVWKSLSDSSSNGRVCRARDDTFDREPLSCQSGCFHDGDQGGQRLRQSSHSCEWCNSAHHRTRSNVVHDSKYFLESWAIHVAVVNGACFLSWWEWLCFFVANGLTHTLMPCCRFDFMCWLTKFVQNLLTLKGIVGIVINCSRWKYDYLRLIPHHYLTSVLIAFARKHPLLASKQ